MNHCGPTITKDTRAVIFDCDGVLVDSWESTRFYFNSIRESVGLPPMDREQELFCFVHTVPVSVARIVPRESLPEALETARQFPFERLLPLVRLQPGITTLLGRLRQAGRMLAVNTNAAGEQHVILRHLGIHARFDCIVTTEDVREGKPSAEGVRLILNRFSLDPEQAIFIGDSGLDRSAAESAGVPFWGYGPHAPKGSVNLRDYGLVSIVS